jgi:hypothetical protein
MSQDQVNPIVVNNYDRAGILFITTLRQWCVNLININMDIKIFDVPRFQIKYNFCGVSECFLIFEE